MGEWKVKELGYLLTEQGYIRGPFGSSLKRGEMVKKGIPVYEQKNAIYNDRSFRFFITLEKFENLKRFQVKTNDLIISCSGTVGKISIISEDDPKGIISQALLILRPDLEKITLRFLYYFLTSRKGFNLITQVSHGSVQINIAARKIVESIPIPTPPLPEQKAIASVLSSLDDKIDLLHRQNKTLEAMAETLFRQWFVEEAQEDWEESNIGKIGNVITGKTPSTKNKKYWGNDIDFITPTDFKNYGKYTGSADRCLSSVGKEKVQNSIIPKDSILVTCIGSDMGKLAVTTKECITNQQINSLIINHSFVSVEYVYQYLKSIYPLLRSMALGGTTMPIINKTDFSNIEIPIPTNEYIANFNTTTSIFNKKILSNTIQLRTLEKLRDTLLPKLMSGEVRVKYNNKEGCSHGK
jgi:type I restriction enzyme, S subunit